MFVRWKYIGFWRCNNIDIWLKCKHRKNFARHPGIIYYRLYYLGIDDLNLKSILHQPIIMVALYLFDFLTCKSWVTLTRISDFYRLFHPDSNLQSYYWSARDLFSRPRTLLNLENLGYEIVKLRVQISIKNTTIFQRKNNVKIHILILLYFSHFKYCILYNELTINLYYARESNSKTGL